jgi:molecular chaperone GrpE
MQSEVKQEENTERVITPFDELLSKYNELEKKLTESEDKYLRLFAEFDNYKKRLQKEKEEIKVSTKNQTLSSVLDLDSDLSIAMKNSKGDNEGLKLIISKLDTFLKNQGIEPIQTETYDADLHEVISVLDVVGEEAITPIVIDVVSKGYTLNGKPFRFPKIILGK